MSYLKGKVVLTFSPGWVNDSAVMADVVDFIQEEVRATKVAYGEVPDRVWRRRLRSLVPAHLGIVRVEEEIENERHLIFCADAPRYW